MKFLPAFILAATLACAPPAGAQAQQGDYYPELITLIAQLANLDALANRCEEQLINFGKDGLRKEMCTTFTTQFHGLWPDGDALSNQILAFAQRSERGEIHCDDTCHSMLRRCEELRIAIMYVFDYIDYTRQP